jgi:beta-1,4-mannooligosaccharide/beta-1,4-mannosyl-N-acetylglucosamine phosphorylase
MEHWGRHRYVMGAAGGWQAAKIGAGPIPMETTEGWLLIYHGVLTSCNGFVYSFGAALLDRDQPWKVVARGEPYLLAPQATYERTGDVPNVAFPCAALVDSDTGRIAIYYGGADTVVCLAFAYVDELVSFVKANNMV